MTGNPAAILTTPRSGSGALQIANMGDQEEMSRYCWHEAAH